MGRVKQDPAFLLVKQYFRNKWGKFDLSKRIFIFKLNSYNNMDDGYL